MSLTKPVTIAVIADVHYATTSSAPHRRSETANILLRRTVARLNRLIRPDVTLVLGDVLNDGRSPEAKERLLELRAILDRLAAPYLAIPGNHDGDEDLFYRVFTRPAAFEDVSGVRFVSFIDQEEPGYNARRSDADLERFKTARMGYEGPLVALQHVCLFPPALSVAPYNYTNAAEVISSMKEAGVTLSISGHHHRGAETTRDENITFVNAPGLCEAPFPFLVVKIESGRIQTQRHELAMPETLRLFDNHLHTQMACCSENMTVGKAVELAHDFGLAGVTFAEHSGQLYFSKEQYWNKTCLQGGMDAAREAENRMSEYLQLKLAHESSFARFGLEADCDYAGRLLLRPDDRKHFDHITGAIHSLPGLTRDAPPQQVDNDAFLFLLGKLLENGISVLAHPFRVFRRCGWAPPPELFRPTAQLLRKHHVSAEINFHTNEPPVEFIRTCLDLCVTFSFGSDAHNLYEIGDFAYHLALLKDAGFNGDLSDILTPQ